MKIRKIQIKKYKIFEDFEIDFTENDKAQNLIVLAGINGSGKTTLLRDVIFEFVKNKFVQEESSVFVEGKNIDGEYIKDLKVNRSEEYPEIINISIRNPHKYIEFPSVYFYKTGTQNHIEAKIAILNFVNKYIYEKDKKASEAYIEVQKIINDIFADFDLQIDFKGVNQEREILFKNNQDEQIRIEDLSSGEQELITKAFTLYLADIKNSIILVDEPEGSMHPNWQSRIASIYQKIADDNNNQVFLATHSPHIVASVKKEQVRVLVKEEGKVKVIQNFMGSYGWRVDKILLEIFRISGLRTPIVENELEEVKKLVSENLFENKEFLEKMQYLENTLGSDDVDLVAIRFEVLRRKKQNEKNQ